MFKKDFINFKKKIDERLMVLIAVVGSLVCFLGLNIFISAQSKENPLEISLPIPNEHKNKPLPTVSPIKTTYLNRHEAEKFYRSFQDALGEDLLDFQNAHDKFFVSEPAIKQYLGRNALPLNLDICQKLKDAKCEKIIAQKIGAADLERYYYLNQEELYLGSLFWIYAEVFDKADQRGLYQLVETEGFNGLQIVIDPQLLEEAEKFKNNDNPINFNEQIKSLENLNLKYKNHFRQLFLKHSFVKQILAELKNTFKLEGTNTKISSQTFYYCQEKSCWMLENYYEVANLKVVREAKSKQLKAFEVFFRMKLF